jgi:hypothetical protein
MAVRTTQRPSCPQVLNEASGQLQLKSKEKQLESLHLLYQLEPICRANSIPKLASIIKDNRTWDFHLLHRRIQKMRFFLMLGTGDLETMTL